MTQCNHGCASGPADGSAGTARRWRAGGALGLASGLAVASLLAVPSTAGAATGDRGTRFVPITPSRVLDTRVGFGRSGSTRPTAGEVVEVQVTGNGGVPAGVAIEALALTVTATQSTAAGFVTAWPTGTARPNTSSLNLERPDQTIANQVVVLAGTGGKVSLYTETGTHLLVDVAGYYERPSTVDLLGGRISSAGRFRSLSPARLLDSRSGVGRAGTTPLGDGDVVELQVVGRGGVPAGASAVDLVVTATDNVAPGFVTAWPTGSPRPNASNLNLDRQGQTIAGHVLVPVGAGGKVSLFVERGTHLLADVNGWFTDQSFLPGRDGLFVPVSQVRLLDTRLGTLVPGPGRPAAITIPADPDFFISGVVGNVTLTQASGPGYLTLWPSSESQPTASNLNLDASGQTRANLATTKHDSCVDRGLSTFLSTSAHVIYDYIGFYGTEALLTRTC